MHSYMQILSWHFGWYELEESQWRNAPADKALLSFTVLWMDIAVLDKQLLRKGK